MAPQIIDYSNPEGFEEYTNRTDHDLAQLTAAFQLPAGLRNAVVLPENLDELTSGSAERYYQLLADLQRWYPRLMIIPFPLPEPAATDPRTARQRVLDLTSDMACALADADVVVRPDFMLSAEQPDTDPLMDLALQISTAANFHIGASMFTPKQLSPETGLVHQYSQLVGVELAVTNSYSTGEVYEHLYNVAVPAPALEADGSFDAESDASFDWLGGLIDFTGEGPQYSNTDAIYEVQVMTCPALPVLEGAAYSSAG